MRISIELGRFIEIMREGDQYVAIFENASWEIPDELIDYASFFYAIYFHRGIILSGEPNDHYLRLFEKDGYIYLSIPMIEEGQIELKGIPANEFSKDFMERFNRSYKAVWIREDPLGEGFISILSYGDSEDEAEKNLREDIIADMIAWINREKQIGFLLEIASAENPQEAIAIAERYGDRYLRRTGKQAKKKKK
ncbi:MAG: hypothetical protein RQ885_13050 [Desulfurococcales archaeon]|jgi:hypothetical protein|nr:hypothetical protein [Desulfurococcales archaeon]